MLARVARCPLPALLQETYKDSAFYYEFVTLTRRSVLIFTTVFFTSDELRSE